jgi:hypothetical protein
MCSNEMCQMYFGFVLLNSVLLIWTVICAHVICFWFAYEAVGFLVFLKKHYNFVGYGRSRLKLYTFIFRQSNQADKKISNFPRPPGWRKLMKKSIIIVGLSWPTESSNFPRPPGWWKLMKKSIIIVGLSWPIESSNFPLASGRLMKIDEKINNYRRPPLADRN